VGMAVAVAEVGPPCPAVLDPIRVQMPERVEQAVDVGEGSVEVVLEGRELLAVFGLMSGSGTYQALFDEGDPTQRSHDLCQRHPDGLGNFRGDLGGPPKASSVSFPRVKAAYRVRLRRGGVVVRPAALS